MSLFEWQSPVNCGDEDVPPANCEPVTSIKTASALRVTDHSTQCERNLEGDEYPAIPVATSSNKVEYRSGTAQQPLKLRIQDNEGTSIPSLLFKLPDGTIKNWIPPKNCIDQKLLVRESGIYLGKDINSNIFETACIGSYASVNYIAGAVTFTDCNGEEKIKLVYFPKSELPTGS